LLAAALALLTWLAVQPVRAADDVRTDSALAQVPADAAFYTAMLRNKEQLKLILESKTYKKLMELPSVQKGIAELKANMKKDGQFGTFLKMLETKENKEAVEVVKDALSNEVFLYGGSGWSDLLAALLKAINAQTFAPLEALAAGGDPNKAQMRAILLSLQKNRALLKVPELVIGFKVSDPKKAEGQLGRLGEHLEQLVSMVPPLKGKLKKGADGLWTLALDGSLIPWEDVSPKEFEEKAGEFDDLMKTLKGMKATVTLGIKKGYVILAFTTSPNDVEKFGGAGKNLGGNEAFQLIEKHAGKPVTAVGYVSKGFRTAAMAGNDFTEMKGSLERALEKADLSAERKKAILKDLDTLVTESKKMIPQFGSTVEVSYLSDVGVESFHYDQTDTSSLKGVKLQLVNHFGGDPIFAAGVGFHVDGTGYDMMVKFLTMAYTHGEAIALEKADDDIRAQYKKFSKVFFPLVQKLNDTTKNQLLPSMKEGGLGIVLDAKWTSKQWTTFWEQPKPLPMPELGLLLGLSDADKFTRAIKEYRTTFNELWEKVREASRDNVPEFKIPAPESEKGKAGTLYFYPIPEDSGLDKRVVPTAGVGKTAAALALSKEHATRLISPTPLKVTSGPLAGKKDLVGASYFNFPALLDAIEPWLDLAPLAVPEDDKEAKTRATQAAKEAKAAFKLLKAIQGFQSATYVEGNVVVTHSALLINDQ
jgi:hypothetical protein